MDWFLEDICRRQLQLRYWRTVRLLLLTVCLFCPFYLGHRSILLPLLLSTLNPSLPSTIACKVAVRKSLSNFKVCLLELGFCQGYKHELVTRKQRRQIARLVSGLVVVSFASLYQRLRCHLLFMTTLLSSFSYLSFLEFV